MAVSYTHLFVPFEMPDISGKQYCAIVCDNATLERMIGLEYYQNAAASIVIDHHASNAVSYTHLLLQMTRS